MNESHTWSIEFLNVGPIGKPVKVGCTVATDKRDTKASSITDQIKLANKESVSSPIHFECKKTNREIKQVMSFMQKWVTLVKQENVNG